MMEVRFEILDPQGLTAGTERAVSGLLARRSEWLGGKPLRVASALGEVPLSSSSRLLMAYRGQQLFGVAVFQQLVNDDPALAAVEGHAPVISSTSAFEADEGLSFTACGSALEEVIAKEFPRADRLTVHAPVADDQTSKSLGCLGFALDSYMAVMDHQSAQEGVAAPSSVTVRPAAEADSALIAALEAVQFAIQAETSRFTDLSGVAETERAGHFRAVLGDPEAALLVAEHGPGNVVGAVQLSWFDVPDDGKIRRLPAGSAGAIDWISVFEGYRRRGVGSALVSAAVQEFVSRKVGTIYVFHGAANPYSSTQFWARFGFRDLWATWERDL
jgi:ribosomal protein S18 acetylase RimI-like enzyme